MKYRFISSGCLFVFLAACSSEDRQPISAPPVVQPLVAYENKGPYDVEKLEKQTFFGVDGETEFNVFVPFSRDPRPFVVFGTSNNKDKCEQLSSYDSLLEHIASYGFVVAVPQQRKLSCVRPNEQNIRDRASDLQSVARVLRDWNNDAIDPLSNFYVGHSRGGGAAVLAANEDENARAAVALTPISLRSYGFTELELREFPVLNIIAGADSDLTYPYGESFEEMLVGNYASVVLHGALHTFIGDDLPLRDAAEPGVEKADQQDTIRALVSAFLNFQNDDDPALEQAFWGPDYVTDLEATLGNKISHRWVSDAWTVLEALDDADLLVTSLENVVVTPPNDANVAYTYGNNDRHGDAVCLRVAPDEQTAISVAIPEEARSLTFHARSEEAGTLTVSCDEARIDYELNDRFQSFVVDVTSCETADLSVSRASDFDDFAVDLRR